MQHVSIPPVLLVLLLAAACGGSDDATGPSTDAPSTAPEVAAPEAVGEGEEHEHAEDPLGTLSLGALELELAQGHGGVVAGKEGHLVVKLPYSDAGATIVRAWIGTQDRTLSYVGKGEYAPSHDDYDVHAIAPDPLPANPLWWIELEQPDGTKLVGSAQPLFE